MTSDANSITIAIDGYSSCGKSTLARDLARELNYLYIDSGAMYRAVTLFLIRNNIEPGNTEAVAQALEHIQIDFRPVQGTQHTFLNDEDVEEEIRGMEVSMKVSPVSAVSAVRRKMVGQQREFGRAKGVVMDGRDIGSVVFPDAELKLFITASKEVRVERRFKELTAKGIEVTRGEVEKSITERDYIDSTRKDSPLVKTHDAVEIDNSGLTRSGQLSVALDIARNRINRNTNNSPGSDTLDQTGL